jgi:Invasin, domain 3/Bacterial Ig-like domain (group 1)
MIMKRRKARLIVVLALVLAISLTAALIASPTGVQAQKKPKVGSQANSNLVADISGTPCGVPPAQCIIAADGVGFVNVTITVRDVTNAPVLGDQINITPAPSGTLSITFPSGNLTNASGQVIVHVSATAPQTITLGAVDSTAGFTFTQTVNIRFDPPPPSNTNSTITSNPGIVPADNTATSLITVTLKDAGNHALSGRQVALVANPNAGVTIADASPGSSITNGLGVATFNVKSTTPATVTFTPRDMTYGGLTLTITTTVNFTPPPPSATNTTVVSNVSTVPADGASFATITVTVKDAGNNVITNPPTAVTVSLPSPNPGIISVVPASGTTNAAGQVVFQASATSPVSNAQFHALLNASITTTQFATVTFTPPPASVANSTVAAAPLSVQADGVSFSTVTVTLRDAGNNPTANKLVTLAASPNTGVGIQAASPGSDTTNGSGVATFHVTSTTAGAVTITATDATDSVVLSQPSQKPVITFTAPVPSATNSTMTRTPAVGNIPADGTSVVTITVTLRNNAGGIVPGKTVNLTFNPAITGLNIQPAASQTDTNNDGILIWTVTDIGSTTQTTIFTATDTTDSVTVSQQVSVTFVPPAASNALSTVTASPTTVAADNVATSTITVTLKDQGSNPTPNKQVTLTANPPAGVTINAPNPTTTNGAGVATFIVRSSVVASVTFTARDDTDAITLTSTATVNFTSAPASPANSSVTVNPTSVIANGGATPAGLSTITLTLRDVGNNPASGKLIQINATPSANVVFQPGTTNASDAMGNVTFRVGSSVAQVVTFTFTDITDSINPFTPATGPNPVQVTFTTSSGPVDGTKSSITANPTTLNADGVATSTITVTLKDVNGTVVQGKTVALVSNPNPLPAGFVLSAASGPSNASGQVTYTLRSTTPGTVSFTAQVPSDGVLVNGSVSITFNPVGSPVSATNSTVVATGSPAPNDGTTPITITVTLRDAANAPVAGKTVTISSNRGITDTITPASATSNAGGIAVFQVTSLTSGPATITAIGDGVTLNQKPNIYFNPTSSPVSPTTSTVTISPLTPQPANGIAAFTITVTLRDAASAAVPGKIVSINTTRGTPAPDNVMPASATSNASGVATFTMTSTTAGSGNVMATGDGVLLTQQPGYTFNPVASPVSPTTSTVVATPASVPADNTTTITVVVTLKDAANVPVGNKTVTVSTARGAVDTVAPASAISNPANGQAIFTIRSGTPGTTTVIAVGDGVTLAQQPAIAFTAVSGGVDPTTSTITATGSPAPADGVSIITITVTARDASSAPLPGKTVTLNSAPASVLITPSTGTTNASGQAIFQARSTVPGTYTISAVAGGITLTQTVQIQFTALQPSAATSTINVFPASVPADGFTNATIVVTLRDSGSNPVSGKNITLNTNPNPLPAGMVLSGTTGVTGANGQVSFTIHSSVQGTAAFSATDTTDGITITNPPPGGSTTVTFTAPPNPNAISPTLSTVTAIPTSVPADGVSFSTITVSLRTNSGLPASGAMVTLTGNPATGVTVTPAVSQVVDVNGNASWQVRSTVVQSVTFVVIAQNAFGIVTLAQQPVVNFTGSVAGGPVSATNSKLFADCSSIAADNIKFATITAQLRDGNNNPVGGKVVTLSWSPALSGMTVQPNPPTVTANSGGIATFTVRSVTQGGPVTFTATDTSDNVVIANTIQITFTAPGTGCVPTGTGTPTPTLGILGVPETGGGSIGVVVPFRLCVRTGPGTAFPAIGRLRGRTQVILLAKNALGTAKNFPPRPDCQGGRGGATWFLIQLDNGQVGWVSAFYIRVRRLASAHLPIVDPSTIKNVAPAASAGLVVAMAEPTAAPRP